MIRFHAHCLQTFSRLCADKVLALQTFCRNRAHTEQSLRVSFYCRGATGWGPLALSMGRGGGATAAAASAYFAGFALGEAVAMALESGGGGAPYRVAQSLSNVSQSENVSTCMYQSMLACTLPEMRYAVISSYTVPDM
jgi:hypothetical protein